MSKRKEFEQIRALHKELQDLERRLEHPAATLQVIFYKDYRTGKGIPKSDVGYDDGGAEIAKLTRQIAKTRSAGVRKIQELEEWLEEIPDPETRTILRKYYFDGATQDEIAEELCYSRSRIAQRINTFWSSQRREG